MGTAAKPFNLLAGHPALELVNTLDSRFSSDAQDLIPTYGDLLRLTAQLQLLSDQQARKLMRSVEAQDAQRVLAGTVELREALAAVFYGRIEGGKPPARQLEILEKHFHTAAQHLSLKAGESHLIWSWSSVEQSPEIPLWKLAQAASDLLVSSDAELVKDCGDPTCRWLFLDVKQEPHSPLVRHEDLRQPNEGATTPGALSGRRSFSLTDVN